MHLLMSPSRRYFESKGSASPAHRAKIALLVQRSYLPRPPRGPNKLCHGKSEGAAGRENGWLGVSMREGPTIASMAYWTSANLFRGEMATATGLNMPVMLHRDRALITLQTPISRLTSLSISRDPPSAYHHHRRLSQK